MLVKPLHALWSRWGRLYVYGCSRGSVCYVVLFLFVCRTNYNEQYGCLCLSKFNTSCVGEYGWKCDLFSCRMYLARSIQRIGNQCRSIHITRHIGNIREYGYVTNLGQTEYESNQRFKRYQSNESSQPYYSLLFFLHHKHDRIGTRSQCWTRLDSHHIQYRV